MSPMPRPVPRDVGWTSLGIRIPTRDKFRALKRRAKAENLTDDSFLDRILDSVGPDLKLLLVAERPKK